MSVVSGQLLVVSSK